MTLDWRGYFEWFPDYRIGVREVMVSAGCGDQLALFGFAEGTCRGWRGGWIGMDLQGGEYGLGLKGANADRTGLKEANAD